MSFLCCPNCGKQLQKNGNAYSCESGHSFDIAKSGYVNLLLKSGQGRHGDDKAMVRARTEFLNKGYYAPLANKLAEIIKEFEPSILIDAGCGEGYYTEQIAHQLENGHVYGLDISKDALLAASKRCKTATFAVASTSSMPFKEQTADGILNIFSPLFETEFHRVLKQKGILIRVIPLETHLHELREVVYDHPYDNDVPDLNIEGFQITKKEELKYTITLETTEDILSLFRMTPYFYKTGREDQEKLEHCEQLTTSIEFGIIVYEKK